ncbi:putative cytochrome P450 [Cutaneotrichosporon oleaginosum]|uniref:Putative cytochrome P450 n=1 Tax=Cutaneotrichosporon oleaginosum TaxID=879819 RepID=A0A0J0XXH8_9TREE|nr:putative cytochrome P450 [Cutaneotrichosporon oleaginosum]KLT45743.1 putative cytochrome P450 [Cutaneotrichosporon oleaginosum]
MLAGLADAPRWALYSVAATILFTAFMIYRYPYRERVLHYRNLPGPPSSHFLFGDFPKVQSHPTGRVMQAWFDEYGPTVRAKLLLGDNLIVTSDTTAMAFIMQHADHFIKPPAQTRMITRLLGHGLLNVNFDTHRRQRRVLNPAFHPDAIRDMVPHMFTKAYELRDKLMEACADPEYYDPETAAPRPEDVVPGARKVNMNKYLINTTFDVIGLAGFDYEFGCLRTGNHIVTTFRNAMSELQRLTLFGVLQQMIPALDVIPSKRNKLADQARIGTSGVGRECIARKRREMEAMHQDDLNKGTFVGKDLLSLMLKANMAKDLLPRDRLDDTEMAYQVSTFILAGSETTSNSLTWTLYRLAMNPDVQQRLREELDTLASDEPSLEQLNTLPYLENVIHESLRLDPPVPESMRMVTQDVMLPLHTPVKGRDGTMIDSVPMKKGDMIITGYMQVNHNKEIWGADADRFNPDRFDRPGIPARKAPGTWGNITSFNGGNRNCIGYRFALAEIKAILFVLLRHFQFEMLPSSPTITAKNFIIMLPWVVGEENVGSQMPLMVRPIVE